MLVTRSPVMLQLLICSSCNCWKAVGLPHSAGKRPVMVTFMLPSISSATRAGKEPLLPHEPGNVPVTHLPMKLVLWGFWFVAASSPACLRAPACFLKECQCARMPARLLHAQTSHHICTVILTLTVSNVVSSASLFMTSCAEAGTSRKSSLNVGMPQTWKGVLSS